MLAKFHFAGEGEAKLRGTVHSQVELGNEVMALTCCKDAPSSATTSTARHLHGGWQGCGGSRCLDVQSASLERIDS